MYRIEARASGIEGLGLFAVEDIPAGDRIRRLEIRREVTADLPLRPELDERFDHCDYADGRVFLLADPDRLLNHCCDPNGWVEYEGHQGFLSARRDIAAGEEITVDYNINLVGGSAWPCHCGAARCRGSTTGDYFLLPPAIRAEYRPLLADWFVRTHAERLAADASPSPPLRS